MSQPFQTEGPYDPAPVYSDVMLGDIGSLTPPDPKIAEQIRVLVEKIRRTMPHIGPGEPELAAFQFACISETVQISRDLISYMVPIIMMRTTDGPVPFSDEQIEDPHFEPDIPYIMDGQLLFARDQEHVISSSYNADVIFSVMVMDPEQPYVLSLFVNEDAIQFLRSDADYCEGCGGIASPDEHLGDEEDEPHETGGTEFDAIIRNSFGENMLTDAAYVSEEAANIFREMVFWFYVQVAELRSRFFS